MTEKQKQATPCDSYAALLRAADNMDWGQPSAAWAPCFHLCSDGRFCGRAPHWAGHEQGRAHNYASIADLVRAVVAIAVSAKGDG